jgi:DNA-binding CsgD family transcriptional regulator
MAVPAGLLDQNVEFFTEGRQTVAIQGGSVKSVLSISARANSILLMNYRQNKVAQTLYKSWGITEESECLVEYAKCLFSGLDNMPDIDIKTGVITPEVCCCNRKMSCEGYGKVCKASILSPKEILVAQAIATGKPDKALHEELRITLNTLRDYKKNIYKKLDCHSRVEMVNCLNLAL